MLCYMIEYSKINCGSQPVSTYQASDITKEREHDVHISYFLLEIRSDIILL